MAMILFDEAQKSDSKLPITLDEICEGVGEVKRVSTRFKIGFSFIITWKGAFINDTKIVENIGEIVMGAERARKYGFDVPQRADPDAVWFFAVRAPTAGAAG